MGLLVQKLLPPLLALRELAAVELFALVLQEPSLDDPPYTDR